MVTSPSEVFSVVANNTDEIESNRRLQNSEVIEEYTRCFSCGLLQTSTYKSLPHHRCLDSLANDLFCLSFACSSVAPIVFGLGIRTSSIIAIIVDILFVMIVCSGIGSAHESRSFSSSISSSDTDGRRTKRWTPETSPAIPTLLQDMQQCSLFSP